jgi:hypothetical protein
MQILLVISFATQQPASPPPPPPAPAKATIEFTGTVLMNGFYNSARTNNSDVPVFADTDAVGISGASATMRQTRLGAFVTDPDVLGGSFSGEIDLDFFGGQQPAPGNRTFPLIRLRRAIATVEWTHLQLMFGQETPLVSDRNPRSLAGVAIPDFSTAGNLWFWLPQVRVTAEYGTDMRFAIQGAVLAPISGAIQGAVATQPDSGERTSRPYLEGRLRLGWGPSDDPSEVAIGGHIGWLRGVYSAGTDSMIQSHAITFDTRIKLGRAELIGEAFSGQAISGLGCGGIGQYAGVGGAPVHTTGGWGQLNLRASRAWMFGGGCGIDDPKDSDVLATGRFRNLVCEGHVEWRPPGPLIFGFEYRQLKTRYATGDFTANHVNLAAGFRF